MRKFNMRLALVLGLVLTLMMMVGPRAWAGADNVLALKLSDYDYVMDKVGGKDLTFTYWKIEDDLRQEDFVEKYTDLFKWTDERLDATYGRRLAKLSLEDGKAVIRGIEDGTYFAKHVINTDELVYSSAMVFQFLAGGPDSFEIEAKRIEIPETKVQLIKTDQVGDRLAGVEFMLYKLEEGHETLIEFDGLGRPVKAGQALTSVLRTDENGAITVLGLDEGDYIFRETKPLEGYRIVERDKHFSLVKGGEVLVTVQNIKDQVGDYYFYKVASGDKKKALEGAEFKLARLVNGKKEILKDDKGNDLVIASDREGKAAIKGQPYGKYVIWEVKAPEGYILSSEEFEFEISAQSEKAGVGLTIYNKKKPGISKIFPNVKTGDIGIGVSLMALVVATGAVFVIKYKKKEN